MKSIHKVIVTGASGNLGSHIVGNREFDFLPLAKDNWNILETVAESSYHAIIHCAYDLKNSINESPTKNLDSNIMSTARILEVGLRKKITNFIFVSSCAVYGDSSNSTEDKPCQPVTINGYIKLFNEELVKSYCAANKIKYQILRVFNTYGGKDRFSVVHKLINCAKLKKPFILVNEGVSERDFIHVDNAAQIICQLLKRGCKNEIINIGSGDSVKIADLVRAVQEKYKDLRIEKMTNPNESVFSRANIAKLNHMVKVQPTRVIDFIDQLL